MPTSPKAETMPGGAPLRKKSKRPCKYGARTEEGTCPKKPRSSTGSSSTSSSSAAKKKPCKYGDRVDGKCPKKPKAPKSARTPRVKELKSVSGAAEQAGEVLRSKKATREQKHEAVRVLGTAVAGEATKKVGEHIAREAKKAARTPAGRAAAKKALTKAAAVAGVVPTAAAIGATLYVGGKVLKANRSRECKAWAKRQLADTKRRLTQKLDAAQEATLLRQYEEHCAKQPVTNPYTGK